MAFEFWAFIGVASLLGLKHAYDADHLVAVSALLTRTDRVHQAVALSGSWAAGHMLTAGAVSALLFFFADAYLERFTDRFETLVPAMLIVIGVLALLSEWRRFHIHRHRHERGREEHAHFHVHRRRVHEHGAMAGIGVVHGLASNDELLIVLLAGLAAESWWQVFLGVVLFSLGVVVGMAIYAAAIQAASRRTGATWAAPALTVTFALLSIAYAVYLLRGGEGMNFVQRFLP